MIVKRYPPIATRTVKSTSGRLTTITVAKIEWVKDHDSKRFKDGTYYAVFSPGFCGAEMCIKWRTRSDAMDHLQSVVNAHLEDGSELIW